MESIIRNVSDIASDERRIYESVVGHALQENQRVILRVVEPGSEPDESTRKAALGRAAEIARQGRKASAEQGFTPEEADAAVDEAVQRIRQAKP